MDTRDKHGFESHSEDSLRNKAVSYEPRDLGARGILVFLIVLFVAGVAIHLIVWGLFEVFSWQATRKDPPLNPLAAGERQGPYVNTILQNTPAVNIQQFPEPRLQPDHIGDMEKFRVQEETILNSQPWRDQSGAVHISIEEAIKLVAQRGLPSRPAPQSTSAVPQGTVQGAPMGQTEAGNVNLQRQDEQGATTQSAPAPKQEQQQQQH